MARTRNGHGRRSGWGVPWYKLKLLRASFGLQCDRSIDRDSNLPGSLLVGPDGKIVAKDLHGDAIKAAIAKALGKKVMLEFDAENLRAILAQTITDQRAT